VLYGLSVIKIYVTGTESVRQTRPKTNDFFVWLLVYNATCIPLSGSWGTLSPRFFDWNAPDFVWDRACYRGTHVRRFPRP